MSQPKYGPLTLILLVLTRILLPGFFYRNPPQRVNIRIRNLSDVNTTHLTLISSQMKDVPKTIWLLFTST